MPPWDSTPVRSPENRYPLFCDSSKHIPFIIFLFRTLLFWRFGVIQSKQTPLYTLNNNIRDITFRLQRRFINSCETRLYSMLYYFTKQFKIDGRRVIHLVTHPEELRFYCSLSITPCILTEDYTILLLFLYSILIHLLRIFRWSLLGNTNWQHSCQLVSPGACTLADELAKKQCTIGLHF